MNKLVRVCLSAVGICSTVSAFEKNTASMIAKKQSQASNSTVVSFDDPHRVKDCMTHPKTLEVTLQPVILDLIRSGNMTLENVGHVVEFSTRRSLMWYFENANSSDPHLAELLKGIKVTRIPDAVTSVARLVGMVKGIKVTNLPDGVTSRGHPLVSNLPGCAAEEVANRLKIVYPDFFANVTLAKDCMTHPKTLEVTLQPVILDLIRSGNMTLENVGHVIEFSTRRSLVWYFENANSSDAHLAELLKGIKVTRIPDTVTSVASLVGMVKGIKVTNLPDGVTSRGHPLVSNLPGCAAEEVANRLKIVYPDFFANVTLAN